MYSRLRLDVSQVVEELRQVGLQQPLELQAQRHNPLQQHMCSVTVDINTQTEVFCLVI